MYYHRQEILSGEEYLSSHFQVKEIACKCCGLVRVEKLFMAHLEALREACGFPLPLNSACRCPAHNKAEDGREGSFHLTDNPKYPVAGTCAVDVRWVNWRKEKKEKLIAEAKRLGWSIGTANSFCHLDKRSRYMDYLRVDFTYPGFLGL